MKKINKIISIILSLCISSAAFVAAGCGESEGGSTSDVTPLVNWDPDKKPADDAGDDTGKEEGNKKDEGSSTTPDNPKEETKVNPENKTPKSIEVETKPAKSDYVKGETVDLTGGVIKITYTDGTTELVSMTAEELTVTAPQLTATGTKKVTVKYGKKSTLFYVKVVDKSFKVTFDANYEGSESTVQTILNGEKATKETPKRSGYTLYGWYASKDFIEQFDFESEITEDVTLYALWKEDGATYVNVTFDYNYYGQRINSYSYPVKSGSAIAKPAADPVRTGYSFGGWVTGSGSAFDFSAAISSDTTVKASWTKTVTGKNDYVFEAENTDLTGKIGPALSGQAVEEGMIIRPKTERGASEGKAVSYLYQTGLYLDFDFASDEDVTDATLMISLSQEYVDYTYDSSKFTVLLNDETLSYSQIVLNNVPYADDNNADCLTFEYYLIGSNLTLKKGANKIRLYVADDTPIEGTTMKAHAPIVDAIKINTSAVLIWDGSKGLPKSYK